MLTRKGFARRKLLERASGAILYYPLLKILDANDIYAATNVTKRILFTYFPSGVYIDRWTPSGGDKSGPLGSMKEITKPLEVHKDQLIMFRGLCFRGGRDHNGAMCQVLAGWGNTGNDRTSQNMEPKPYSVDQRIADRIGKDSHKSSINLGIHTSRDVPFTEPLSWKQGGIENKPVDNPKASFADIFGNFMVPGANQQEAETNVLYGKKRIIDFLKGDMNRIKNGLSGNDKSAFESHVEALNGIERDINVAMKNLIDKPVDNGPPIAKICGPANAINSKFPGNTNGDWYLNDSVKPQIFNLQREIILQAFACNVTRVAVWQIGSSHTDGQLHAEGINPGPIGHHLSAHSDTQTYADLNRGHIQEISKLVSSFKSTAMGDHTLFDEVLTFGATCIGENATGHGKDNIPSFLIGNAWGQLKTNRMIAYNYQNYGGDGQGKTYNHLLVSVAHLMGLTDVDFIGNTSARGPLQELMQG